MKLIWRGESRLDVRYEHPGDMYLPLSTNYRAYLRAYVPADHSVKNAELSGREEIYFMRDKLLKCRSVPIKP